MLYDSSGVRVMEFNANFNNISVISWCSIFSVSALALFIKYIFIISLSKVLLPQA
jgi:hypothetical protein